MVLDAEVVNFVDTRPCTHWIVFKVNNFASHNVDPLVLEVGQAGGSELRAQFFQRSCFEVVMLGHAREFSVDDKVFKVFSLLVADNRFEPEQVSLDQYRLSVTQIVVVPKRMHIIWFFLHDDAFPVVEKKYVPLCHEVKLLSRRLQCHADLNPRNGTLIAELVEELQENNLVVGQEGQNLHEDAVRGPKAP